ncbi:MAG TPA: Rieske (2Fe-2S) protein, partial [Gammaproteobacteria bacterium]|nr:Rieske (2Fe-2S) protein [Gammaproteobacteria bacterium]
RASPSPGLLHFAPAHRGGGFSRSTQRLSKSGAAPTISLIPSSSGFTIPHMRRSVALVNVSRRQFCERLASCLGLAAIAGCTAGQPSADDAGGACGNQSFDCGPASMFVSEMPVFFSSGLFFVVRDPSGLYAVSAICTHEGGTINLMGSDYVCPRHGATFDLDGNVLGGPATLALPHLEMCMLANGHIGVNPSVQVPATQRLSA